MTDAAFMRVALRLARRAYGRTSPNPMVGAVLVKSGKVIGRGWHHQAGEPHAEIEALRDAHKNGSNPRGATLFVTLEPCCTHGRTPPCTDAIIAAGIKRVVVGTADPNPSHAGKGFDILAKAGIRVSRCGETESGRKVAGECDGLNEAFNHWIVHRTPLVTVKAGMTLDGKIATADGESKWITGEKARAWGQKLRQGSDAILVGVNTLLADDPSLTFRKQKADAEKRKAESGKRNRLRRIILDSRARTPLTARVVSDDQAALTTIVVGRQAPKRRVDALKKRVKVLVAPAKASGIDLGWLLKKLGAENVTSLLVEGGGEVNASFLLGGRAHRVAFFYAPKILGGRRSRKAVAGDGAKSPIEAFHLCEVQWRRLGEDLLLTARVQPGLE